MLESLYIENAAVTKNVSIDFSEGFNVITGETGSGKSVMIDCLELITGDRTDRDIVRSGEDRTVVSAMFRLSRENAERLEKLGIEADENGEVLVNRTVTADGKSTVKINGRPQTISVLKSAGPTLIGINTQNERSFLSDTAEYTGILDSYAEDFGELEAYREKYEAALKKQREIDELKADIKEKVMMTDILAFQLKEIDSVKLGATDEEEKLERLRTKIKSIEKTAKYKKIVTKALTQSDTGVTAEYLVERALAALEQLSDVVENSASLMERLNNVKYEISDISDTVESELTLDIDGDPAEQLTRIETRLSQIEKLKKKYGDSIAEIKAYRENTAQKLRKIESSDDAIKELEDELKVLMTSVNEAALKLHEARRKSAEILSAEITDTIKFLDMPKTKFRVTVTENTGAGLDRYTNDGGDTVDFMISVNPGEPMMSLSKVASGGEMSRVMLAMRSSMNKKSGSETVVFDEIDSGVSGSTSEKIGMMLKKLSENVQVLCVTHSPQIAALAGNHYLITKKEVNGRAESSIKLLDNDERIEEIARIIGGINVTDKQREAARELRLHNG